MPQFHDQPRVTTIHSYDGDGIYVSSRQKRIPRGVSLPAKATEVAPLPQRAGFAVVFDETAQTWSYAPDHRGETRYRPDGEPVVIDFVGEVPANLLVERPPRSRQQRIAQLRQVVRMQMASVAESAGFDSIVDAISYADEPTEPVRQTKGLALRAWRSACWVVFDTEIQGQLPDGDELLAALPAAPEF